MNNQNKELVSKIYDEVLKKSSVVNVELLKKIISDEIYVLSANTHNRTICFNAIIDRISKEAVVRGISPKDKIIDEIKEIKDTDFEGVTRENIMKDLNIKNLLNKGDIVERLFCAAITTQTTNVMNAIMVRYRKLIDILFPKNAMFLIEDPDLKTDIEPIEEDAQLYKESEFEKELEILINRYSQENGSNTPDWILAEYMKRSLATFNTIVNKRDKWYNVKLTPGSSCFLKEENKSQEELRENNIDISDTLSLNEIK